jgi:UDP-N-acetylmuramyl tripeptide synthase
MPSQSPTWTIKRNGDASEYKSFKTYLFNPFDGRFQGKVLEDNFDGMLMEMNGYEIVVPFIGRFNASNLLAVFGAAVLLGKSEEEVLVQLSVARCFWPF